MIDDGWGNRGSGFLVRREVETGISKVFLVTNKHVLDEDPTTRRNMTDVQLHMNVKRGLGVVGEAFDYPLCWNGKSVVREHPDDEVDVLAIDVTYLFEARPRISLRSRPTA